MPSDNAATVAPGSPVLFPNAGPAKVGSAITSMGGGVFQLANSGMYYVSFQVSVTGPGQLVVVVGGTENVHTIVGRDTGTTQIVGTTMIYTPGANTNLQISNPAANPAALAITPYAGSTANPVSAHLVIMQVA
jgi:hypothetical protein